jgi:hypothetical protein
MKTRTHRHTINFPIFSYRITVVFTADIPRECKRLTSEDPTPGTIALTVLNGDGFSHILLPHDACAESIAHESFHAIYHLMTRAGAQLEDEVIAYHLGHVVGLIHRWGKLDAKKDAETDRAGSVADGEGKQ